jgi:deoxyuridine 5'-triphosphate nucleotidohydrolase
MQTTAQMKKRLMDVVDETSDYTMEDFTKEFGQVPMVTGESKMQVFFVNKSDNPSPEFATAGAAGFDFRANLPEGPMEILSGKWVIVPTGLFFEIPQHFEMQIRPRSGLAAKNGITVLNSPGTIDCVPKGTKINTVNGDILVEELFVSIKKESICSYNEDTKLIEEDNVSDMWVVNDLELMMITTEDNDILTVPITKEVLTEGGWKRVKNLTTDDKILKII